MHRDTGKPARPRDSGKPRKRRMSTIRRLHSPALMLTIVVVLLAYLLFYLARQFGIEGEGGWLVEVGGSLLAIFGIIVTAIMVVVVFLWIKSKIRKRTPAPWLDDIEEGMHHDE